ncbi:hypothetical protein L7F22_015494, partial [Adiantum nelumboides]|nr:hypothetical protein [Adiantum nelumboides]
MVGTSKLAPPRRSTPSYPVDLSEDEYEQYSASYPLIGLYDRPLPCFGCGMGWFS